MNGFQIGEWSYLENSGTLKCGSTERVLEPLIENLLVYFIKNHDRVITRQELIENVWQMSFVDDNSINRAISELRKQFKLPQSNQIFIKTHYRKGYSLTFTPKALTPKQAANNLDTKTTTHTQTDFSAELVTSNSIASKTADQTTIAPTNHDSHIRNHKWLYLILPIIVLLVFYVAKISSDTTTTEQTETVSSTPQSHRAVEATQQSPSGRPVGFTTKIKTTSVPATWQKGAEYWPAISSDKQLFSFVNSQDGVSKSYVSHLNDDRTVPIIYKDYQTIAASWQINTSKVLVKLLGNSRNDCMWALFETKDFPKIEFDKTVMPCPNAGFTLAYMAPDGEGIYYTEPKDGAFHISYWDLETESSTIVLPSYGQYLGIRLFELSPDGKQILYQREVQKQPTDVFIYNLETKENKKILSFPFGEVVKMARWYGDGQSIIWNGEGNLKWLDLKTNVTTTLEFVDKRNMRHVAVINKNQALTVDEAPPENQLKVFDMAFNVLEDDVFQADGVNQFPRFTNDGLIFVSNRSGAYQYWFFKDQLRRLTSISEADSKIIYPPTASRDGSLYVIHYQENVYLMDRYTGEKRKVEFPSDHFVNNAVIGPDNRKLFAVITVDKRIQLWQYDLITGKYEKIESKEPRQLLTAPDGHVYYTSFNSLVGVTKPLTIELPISLNIYQNMMSITNEHFYVYFSSTNTVYRINLNDSEMTEIEVPMKLSGISVSADDTKIAATTAIDHNTQVKRTQWQEVSAIPANN